MKKTIQFLLVMLLLFFIADRIVAFCLNKIYTQSITGPSTGKLTYLLKQPTNFEVLVMGSSRANHHLMPDSLGISAYNLGWGGTEIMFQYGLLSILEKENKLPQKIILAIEENDYFYSNEMKSDTANIAANISSLKYYYDKNEAVKKMIDSVSATNRYKYLLKSFQYNGNMGSLLISFFNSRKNKAKLNGYEPFSFDKQDSLKVLLMAAENGKTKSLRKNQINSRAFFYLEKIAKLCEQHHIKLVCYASPVFGGNEKTFPDRTVLNNFFAEQKINYTDFNSPENKIELLSNSKYWHDGVHLNVAGASIFTHQFKKVNANF